MNRITLLISLLTFALSVQSQNFGEIHGRILFEDGIGVPNANVSVETMSGVKSTTSDSDGRFKLKPLEPATYAVTISFVGCHDKTITNVEVHPNKFRLLGDITLIEDSKMIGQVDVEGVAGPPLIDPEDTGLTTVTYDQIKSNPLIKTPMTLLTVINPGVKQDANGELYFRGSRTGAVQYHVDGVKLTTNVSGVPSSAIGSIQVYTGGVPAKYGDVTGGVVVIETKSFMDLYLKKKYSS